MKDQTPLPLEIYRKAAEFQRIGSRAVRAAQEENQRRGIPNAYSRNGRLYYRLPNGEITDKDPFEKAPAK